MTKELSWEERAFVAANDRRNGEEATKRMDAALRDMTDWRAHCYSCHDDLIGTIPDIAAHMEACKEPASN